MITPWKDYLSPPGRAALYRDCNRRCRSAFENQRAAIAHIFEARRPAAIACLGAGILNDIPYARFIEAGATVHLVDWLPDIVDLGIASGVIRKSGVGAPECLYCRLGHIDAEDYCCNYRRTETSPAGVCDAFRPDPDAPGWCRAFGRGDLPHVHRQDVTGGYAEAFGAGVADKLAGVTSWRQAFKRAIGLANQVKGQRSRLAIPDRSIDLVVSSMVISQFEHEPYDYFSKQAAALLGAPTAQEEVRLRPAMETLRRTLVQNQIAGHCDEIARILAPDGRCFLAFEVFHRAEDGGAWRLVEEMHGAVAALDRRFDFDIDGCPDLVGDTCFRTNGGRSVVYHLLLAAKAGP